MNQIIVALDVDSRADALNLVRQLKGRVGLFKVGSQLFTSEGPEFVREIVREGEKVFLDLKFHDIPNTVTKAVLAAARLGASMLTLHSSGGVKMMSAAANALKETCGAAERPQLLGVTVLTSLADEDLVQVGVQRRRCFTSGTARETRGGSWTRRRCRLTLRVKPVARTPGESYEDCDSRHPPSRQ